ncbi:carboxylic acid transport protein [Dioszegia hungarica]|uniref:Carboxylic acid transport protein n=1 Tax=Dioszegia hungarica TaxID=4972 RepID=A0AA38LW99_9TREE|nr:carboxylic acid transport protein [Dioszegia hungarica]KAI9636346.1 carboxylic acid transport protein [Dioszegia hungarica]
MSAEHKDNHPASPTHYDESTHTTANRASVKDQLATWHVGRGNKSFARAMIPTWYSPPSTEERTTKNPFKLLGMIDRMGWLLFFSGWFAWTCDGYDYFAVPLTVPQLAAAFGVGTVDITTSITLTLLFRSLGAIIFGILADRYGRKWTLVGNLILICVFELATGFVNTFSAFLAVRALFGIAMGGIWGQSAATALENVPVQARGLLSGILQQGYAFGYLLAAVINLTVVQTSPYGWRSIYFIGAGFSLAAAIVRALLPESRQFLLAREEAKERQMTSGQATKSFFREMGAMFKSNWIRCIWGVCMMTGFNFLSHGSQDLYPTYLQVTKGFSSPLSSKTTIVSNCGAIVGGTIAGYVSQYTGRRLAILITLCYTACWIPLWILPDSFAGLTAGGFFMQSGVQGAWGIVPIYLSEIAPPAFRASFAGVAYQLGNMASSGASQIEADAGRSLKLAGTQIADYATIQGILIGAVIAWMVVCVFLGPEANGAHFEQAKVSFQDGAGAARATELVHRGDHDGDAHLEKGREEFVERR